MSNTFVRKTDKETGKLVIHFAKKNLVDWIKRWHEMNSMVLPAEWIIRLEVGAGNDGTIWTYDVHVSEPKPEEKSK